MLSGSAGQTFHMILWAAIRLADWLLKRIFLLFLKPHMGRLQALMYKKINP
jgi:hypothetical protein